MEQLSLVQVKVDWNMTPVLFPKKDLADIMSAVIDCNYGICRKWTDQIGGAQWYWYDCGSHVFATDEPMW